MEKNCNFTDGHRDVNILGKAAAMKKVKVSNNIYIRSCFQ